MIAIDGKTWCIGPIRRKAGSDPIHMVSAFAARQRLVLGQIKVAGKSNEITAIPKLLAMMAIEGAVVTVDAIGCQREIAQAIIDRKADDILALKGNQGTLRDDVALFVAEQKANGFKDTIVSRDRTVDGEHGRIETRAAPRRQRLADGRRRPHARTRRRCRRRSARLLRCPWLPAVFSGQTYLVEAKWHGPQLRLPIS